MPKVPQVVRPTLIEEVEKKHNGNQKFPAGTKRKKGEMRRNTYVMVINKKRRYFNYGEFGHIICHCRNQEVIFN